MKIPSIKLRRGLEVATNIAIIVLTVVIVGNLLQAKLRSKKDLSAPTVGTQMSLTGIKWEENGSTLLMVLQKGCRYCEESASFYRRLRDQRSGSQPRMLAVVPGDKTDVARYLSERGVLVDDIINVSLSDINVSATPTLFLVDRSGKVRDVWVGKLDQRKEAEVAQRILDSH